MSIRVLTLILGFIWCGVGNGFTQTVVTPTTDACSCSGTIVYTSASASSAIFRVYDYQGNLINIINSPDGQFSLGGLCAQAYSCSISQDGIISEFVFNIPTNTINPGTCAMLDICSTNGSLNLNNSLGGFLTGGSWYNPAGLPTSNIVSGASAVDGWYTYHISSGGCEIVTGILVNQVQNANPGLSTTYLICETYQPFSMISPMQGNPDTGGQWYDASNNQPVDGWFYPETMDSGQFYYTISNIDGCPPVTAFLTVVENKLPIPGTDSIITVCSTGTPFNMVNYLGGYVQPGGNWYDPSFSPVSSTFNPATQTGGMYTYLITGFTPCTAQLSHLTINLVTDNPAGTNGSVAVCTGSSPFNMIDYLGGNPSAGGVWYNSANQIVSGIFNPSTQSSGNYTYQNLSVGCSSQQAVLNITVQSPVLAGNDAIVDICETTTSLNLNNLLSSGATLGGVWTNSAGQTIGSTISIDTSAPTQNFTYTVSNPSCPPDMAEFTVNIVSSPPLLHDVSIGVCSTDGQIDLLDYYPGFPYIQFTTTGNNPVSNLFDASVQNSVTYVAINPALGGCPGSQATLSIHIEQPVFESQSISVGVCQADNVFDLNSTSSTINFQNGYWKNELEQAISPLVPLDFTGEREFQFLSDSQVSCSSSIYSVSLNGFEKNNAGSDNSVSLCNTMPPQSLNNLAELIPTANGSWYFNGIPFLHSSFNPAMDAGGVFLFITPSNGACPSDTSSHTIEVQYGINYDAGVDIIHCFGDAPVHIGQPGNQETTYQWSPSTNLNSVTSASPVVNFYNASTQPVTIEYTVVVNDGVCQIEDHIAVTTLPGPSSNLANNYEICRGESVSLSVFGNNITCNWFPNTLFNGSTSQFQLVAPTETTDIEVVVSNEWGCIAYDSTTITIHQLPVISLVPYATYGCSPLEVHYNLQSDNLHNISWKIPGVGNFFGASFTTHVTTPGIYDLTLTAVSPFGCSNTMNYSQVIEVYPDPIADFELTPQEITTVDPIAQFKNTSFGATSYLWDFGGAGQSTEISPSFEFENKDPKEFTICLTAENEFGCIDKECKFLPLKNIYLFYAPTAFTPDNDGLNDGFKPVVLGFEASTYTLRIYNRWGEKIFETNDIDEPWIGNENRGDYYVPEGVYTWRVQVKEKIIANFEVFEGHVVLIR